MCPPPGDRTLACSQFTSFLQQVTGSPQERDIEHAYIDTSS